MNTWASINELRGLRTPQKAPSSEQKGTIQPSTRGYRLEREKQARLLDLDRDPRREFAIKIWLQKRDRELIAQEKELRSRGVCKTCGQYFLTTQGTCMSSKH